MNQLSGYQQTGKGGQGKSSLRRGNITKISLGMKRTENRENQMRLMGENDSKNILCIPKRKETEEVGSSAARNILSQVRSTVPHHSGKYYMLFQFTRFHKCGIV